MENFVGISLGLDDNIDGPFRRHQAGAGTRESVGHRSLYI